MLRKTLPRVVWIAAMLAVLVTSVVPVPKVPELPGYTDKLVHLVCYLLLGLLAVLAQQRPRARLLAAITMIAFGIAIEILQGRLPWRSFEWADVVANTAGVAFGVALGLAASARRPAPVAADR